MSRLITADEPTAGSSFPHPTCISTTAMRDTQCAESATCRRSLSPLERPRSSRPHRRRSRRPDSGRSLLRRTIATAQWHHHVGSVGRSALGDDDRAAASPPARLNPGPASPSIRESGSTRHSTTSLTAILAVPRIRRRASQPVTGCLVEEVRFESGRSNKWNDHEEVGSARNDRGAERGFQNFHRTLPRTATRWPRVQKPQPTKTSPRALRRTRSDDPFLTMT